MCACVRACVHVCVCACVRECVCACARARARVCVFVCARARVCVLAYWARKYGGNGGNMEVTAKVRPRLSHADVTLARKTGGKKADTTTIRLIQSATRTSAGADKARATHTAHALPRYIDTRSSCPCSTVAGTGRVSPPPPPPPSG